MEEAKILRQALREQALAIYINGLKMSLQTIIRARDPKTLEVTIQLARQLEIELSYNTEITQNDVKKEQNANNYNNNKRWSNNYQGNNNNAQKFNNYNSNFKQNYNRRNNGNNERNGNNFNNNYRNNNGNNLPRNNNFNGQNFNRAVIFQIITIIIIRVIIIIRI